MTSVSYNGSFWITTFLMKSPPHSREVIERLNRMMLQVDYFKFSFFFSISNPIVIVQYINISISIIKNFYEFFALHSLMNEKGYLTKIDCPGSIAVTAIKNGKTVPSTDKWMNQYKHFKLPLKTLKIRFQKKLEEIYLLDYTWHIFSLYHVY